ncbi:MAG: pyrroline-5-carboxylate reductase [Eubacteriales bacterium]
MKYKAGFIGCGNMGGALLGAAVRSIGAENCCVCEKHPEKIEKFLSAGASSLDDKGVAANSKFVFLAVKPQAMEKVVSGIVGELSANKDAVIVTMAAGMEISTLEGFLGGEFPIIRIMPNTPCSLGKGVVLYCAGEHVSANDKAEFVSMFEDIGFLDEIDEEKIDAASVVSGCGPAFVYAFAEAIVNAASECGLDKARAILYAAKTLEGAAAMIEQSGKETDELIRNVCSPKGTTIEGIDSLRKNGFDTVVGDAVKASYRRTLELKGK